MRVAHGLNNACVGIVVEQTLVEHLTDTEHDAFDS